MSPAISKSPFRKAFPPSSKANLERARGSLDQLVCSTIHGFAQALIKPYPVEAGIDPGAEIIDPSEADLAFGEHYEAWLRDHLSGQTDDDIVAEFVLADEDDALGLLRSIADFRRHNRDARPAAVDMVDRRRSRSSRKRSRISGAGSRA